MQQPRANFIREQLKIVQTIPSVEVEDIVQNFRLHYPNIGSFASSISRFKSELRKKCVVSEVFLSKLKPTGEETAEVRLKNRKQLELKCKTAVTLRNCGDNLIMFFRSCLEATDLGKLMIGIQACTGMRMVEAVCRGEIEPPKLTHSTDDC